MPIDTEFLNPIISAMVAHRQRQYQQAELAQRGQEFKQEQALKEKAQGDVETNLEREHELRGRELDNQTLLAKGQAESNQIAKLRALNELSGSGVDLNKLIGGGGQSQPPGPQSPLDFKNTFQNGPQQQPPVSSTSPQIANLLQGLNLGAFPTANQQLQRQVGATRAVASAQASGTAEGQAPSVASARDFERERDAAKNEFEKDKVDKEQAFTAGQNALTRTNSLDVAKLSRGTQMSIANMENQTRLQQIGAEYGITPDMASAMTMDIYGGGDQKLDLKNPVMRRLATVADSQGFKDPGKDVDELKGLDAIGPALAKYKDFATNVLSTSKLGRTVQQGVGNAFGTDAKKKEEELAAYLQQIGKGLEGYSGSRQLAAQFGAESKTMPSLGDTQGQALNKVQSFIDNINARKAKILSNYSPKQQELFKARNPGVNFGSVPDVIPKSGESSTPSNNQVIKFEDIK